MDPVASHLACALLLAPCNVGQQISKLADRVSLQAAVGAPKQTVDSGCCRLGSALSNETRNCKKEQNPAQAWAREVPDWVSLGGSSASKQAMKAHLQLLLLSLKLSRVLTRHPLTR